MKTQIAGIELYHLVKEFQELVGGRIDKIYQESEYFLFQIYTGKRRVGLAIELPTAAYLTEHKPAFDKPKGFCMFLRKRLQKGRITAVTQLRFDRVFRIDIEVFDKNYRVWVELFGKGNLLVCDENDKIISAYDNIVYKDRTLRGGVAYEPPNPQPDTPQLTREEFRELCEGEDVERVLATTLGVGGEYAPLLAKEGIDDTYDALTQLLEKTTPCADTHGAYLVGDCTPHETFSSAVASVLDPKREVEKKHDVLKTVSKQQNKLEVRLKAQEKQIKKMGEQARDDQRRGEILYEKYQEFTQLLAQAVKDRKELDEKAFVKKYESLPFVVRADTQTLVIEVPE